MPIGSRTDAHVYGGLGFSPFGREVATLDLNENEFSALLAKGGYW